MARMRSLKPEFWLDRKLARTLSRDQRMLYLGLWNQADEWARANADPRVVKGQVFPFDDDLGLVEIETMLKALEAAGVVVLYEHDGDPYLFLPKLAKHQRLESSKVPSRHPAPPAQPADQQVLTDPGHDPDESAPRPGPAQTSSREIHAKQVAGSRKHVAGTSGLPDGPTFDDFYAAYPRKEARRDAEKAWKTATKRAAPQAIVDGLRRFRFSPERRFIPMPATWLNQDRWADGELTPSTDGSVVVAPTLSRQEIDDVLGADSWQLPHPPMDPEDDPAGYRAWCVKATEEHRAERVRLALAQLARQR